MISNKSLTFNPVTLMPYLGAHPWLVRDAKSHPRYGTWPDRYFSHYQGCKYLYGWQQLHAKKIHLCRGSGGHRPEWGHLVTSSSQGHIHQKSRNNCSDTEFKMGWKKKVDIYIDNWCFATVHVHRQIYKQSSLFTYKGKITKNRYKIVQLIEVTWLPAKLEIIHEPGHQKDKSPQISNGAAFRESKPQTALEQSVVSELQLCLDEDVSKYDPGEIKSSSDLGSQERLSGW